jgi:hypothetical protein
MFAHFGFRQRVTPPSASIYHLRGAAGLSRSAEPLVVFHVHVLPGKVGQWQPDSAARCRRWFCDDGLEKHFVSNEDDSVSCASHGGVHKGTVELADRCTRSACTSTACCSTGSRERSSSTVDADISATECARPSLVERPPAVRPMPAPRPKLSSTYSQKSRLHRHGVFL